MVRMYRWPPNPGSPTPGDTVVPAGGGGCSPFSGQTPAVTSGHEPSTAGTDDGDVGGAGGNCPGAADCGWARLKKARPFHAHGLLATVTATPADGLPPSLQPLAKSCVGEGLVRFSLGLRGPVTGGAPVRDVLGMALRLGPGPQFQDLALATFDRLNRLSQGAQQTNTGDFLANVYRGGSPYWLEGVGPVEVRVSALPASGGIHGTAFGTRLDRLLAASRAGDQLAFELQIPGTDGFVPVLTLKLGSLIELPTLRFSLFRPGAVLRPFGLVAGIRRVAYPVSQWARPAEDQASGAGPAIARPQPGRLTGLRRARKDGRPAAGQIILPAGSHAMCRNIKTLFNFEPPATDEEVRAASLQFVRKLSGFTAPSKLNEEPFNRAVEEVFEVARRLIDGLVTNAPSRDRQTEALKAKARSAERFGRP